MTGAGKISVVVLTHDKVAMSVGCLRALAAALDGLDHEVILLDNASTEDTGPLRDLGAAFQKFVFHRTEENIPFSAINNIGARQASGRWLLFLNNDVFAGAESVRHLLATLREVPESGVVGGKLLFDGGTTVQHAGIGHMLWGYPTNYGVGASPNDKRVQQECERFAVTGAMLCLPREVFEAVGGFDERYIWGVEDIDLCLKVRSLGKRVLYAPGSESTHLESATLKVTQKWDLPHNYRVYRELWDSVLVPRERQYVGELRDMGIRKVAVFGTGLAARGLARALAESGIDIFAFTSSTANGSHETFLDRPVLSLQSLSRHCFDRLIVASQYFFEVEHAIRDVDPLHEPLYPVLM